MTLPLWGTWVGSEMYHQFNYIAYLFLCAISCWTMRGYPEGTTKSHLLGGLVFNVRCHSVEQCDLLTPIATVYIFFFCFMPEHSDLDSMKNAQIFGFNENWPNIQIWIQWKMPKYSDSMKTGRTFRFGFNENRLTANSGPMWSVDTLSLLSSPLSADIWLHRNTS